MRGEEGNRMKKWMGIAMCMAFLLSLLGCQSLNLLHRKPGMLDGPGMINTLAWEGFELSRSDSNFEYTFWFELKSIGDCYILTGECSDMAGNRYESLDGIKVPNAEAEALRKTFALDELSDKTEDADSELSVLDAPMITLTLTYADGSQKQKSIGGDTSMDIYKALLPYFINS